MNLSRIALGLILIAGAGGALSVGGTGAFFSDTETSSGNAFTAGSIDLLVDNESYATDPNGNLILSEGTSWSEDNLNNGDSVLHKFFDFNDVKPSDRGEDTISLHTQNDAYACMDVTLTSNDDSSSTEPELDAGDAPDNGVDLWDGELAQNLQMFWWADDGDNVYEDGEEGISGGVKSLYDLATSSGAFSVALADSNGSIWNTPTLPADVPKYIGKAWCFGTLTPAPVAQDGQGKTGSNGPLNRGMGFTCNGETVGNEAQTDTATLDVAFRAVQARNNPHFVCQECNLTGANLILNADFESPIVNTPQKWDIFPSPVGGWQVAWRDAGPTTFGSQNRPAIANLEYHRGVLGNAYAGEQYVELDSDWGGPSDSGTGEPASVMIYQDIATVPGASYNIHFAFAPRPNTPAADNRLEMRFGGAVGYDSGPVAGGGGPIAWTPHDISLVATTTTTRIQFTDLGTSNSQGTFLDDVNVTQTSCAQPTQEVSLPTSSS